MKIHNTKELRARARSHAKYDHVKQGTYGDGSTNGKTEYQGCAVGCLAVPHKKADLRAFIIANGFFDKFEEMYVMRDVSGDTQRRRVANQFGINESLMIMGEGFFEAQPTHGGAIEFIKNFALAFNEGADFTPAMVRKYAFEHYDQSITEWEEIRCWFKNQNWRSPNPISYDKICAEHTEMFLSWIKGVKK